MPFVCLEFVSKLSRRPWLITYSAMIGNLTMISGNLMRQAGDKSLIRDRFKPASDVFVNLPQRLVSLVRNPPVRL